jgi:hypothetical protein
MGRIFQGFVCSTAFAIILANWGGGSSSRNAAWIAVAALLVLLTHAISERLERRRPAYLRPLDRMYESFHQFLYLVRKAVVASRE